jgi:hypothetical protein
MRDPASGRRFSKTELQWLADHLPEMRRSVSERRIRSQTLWAGLVVGLVVHVIGFLLKSAAAGAPVEVLADLLYTLGYALWTGVVVVALVEIIPAAKERQISRWLDAYEAEIGSRGPPDEDADSESSAGKQG